MKSLMSGPLRSSVTAGFSFCVTFPRFNKYADLLHTSAGFVETADLLPAKLAEPLFEGPGSMGDVVVWVIGVGEKQTVKRVLWLVPRLRSRIRGVCGSWSASLQRSARKLLVRSLIKHCSIAGGVQVLPSTSGSASEPQAAPQSPSSPQPTCKGLKYRSGKGQAHAESTQHPCSLRESDLPTGLPQQFRIPVLF